MKKGFTEWKHSALSIAEPLLVEKPLFLEFEDFVQKEVFLFVPVQELE